MGTLRKQTYRKTILTLKTKHIDQSTKPCMHHPQHSPRRREGSWIARRGNPGGVGEAECNPQLNAPHGSQGRARNPVIQMHFEQALPSQLPSFAKLDS